MANIKAQASGLWSAPGTWSGGVAPGVGDTGFSNTFQVTIDQNITCTAISDAAAAGITAGGNFLISTIPGGGRVINANVAGGSTAGLTSVNGVLDVAASGSVTINGTVQADTGTNARPGVSLTTAGANVTINGNVAAGSVSSYGVVLRAASTLTVTGNVTASTGNGTGGIMAQTGVSTITVNGNLTASATALTSPGVELSTTGSTLIVVGNVTAGANSAGIIGTVAAQVVDVTGTVTASGTSAAIALGSSAVLRLAGALVHGPNNRNPLAVTSFMVKAGQNFDWTVKDDTSSPATGANVHLTNYVTNSPAPANVRLGTTYGPSSSLTGTLAVPPAASVATGVPVDAATGTAALTPAAVWDYLVANAVTAGSMGRRMANVATVDSTGDQIAAMSTI